MWQTIISNMTEATSSTDIQSTMVEEVLENDLPVHVASLAQARQENAAEIVKLQSALTDLEWQYSKGKEILEQLTVEANTLISRICSLEEEGSKTTVHVAELEKQISVAIEKSENLKWQLQLKEDEYCFANRKYSEYKKMMETYKLAVLEAEKNRAIMTEQEALMNEVQILKAKITAMDTVHKIKVKQTGSEGKTVDDIRKEMALLEQVVDKERLSLVEAQKKLEECQQKRHGMETANAILKKKNAALLTRLKRQVDEQIEKHEQTTGHIKYLMEKIETTKAKLHLINTAHITTIE